MRASHGPGIRDRRRSQRTWTTWVLIPVLPVFLLLFWAPTAVATAPTASETLDVVIHASADPADVGHPFEVSAILQVPSVVPYVFRWIDSEGATGSGPTWTLVAQLPGLLGVTLQVETSEGTVGTATASVRVVPPPSVSVAFPYGQVELDVPVPFYLDLQGGVSPFVGTWNASGEGVSGNFTAYQDGEYSERVEFASTGPASIVVRVSDALGVNATAVGATFTVVPGTTVQMLPASSVGEVGTPILLNVLVAYGTPPFRWTLSSSLPLSPGTTSVGAFPADGIFARNLTFLQPGTLTLNLSLLDGLGVVDNTSATLTILPPLGVNITDGGMVSGDAIEVRIGVSGGLPPYIYRATLSDGEETNGSLSGPGALVQVFDPPEPGLYVEHVEVTDALGVTVTLSRQVLIEPAPDPPASATVSSAAVGVGALTLLLAIGAGLFLLKWRRRGKPPLESAPGHSGLPTVRSILEREHVIDRETLLLLCEEAGESAESVSVALRALLRAGSVVSEAGPGSDEILRWQGAEPPGASR